MGFPRQEYWSGLPFPSLGDLPDPGIEPRSPTLQAESLPTELGGKRITQLVGARNRLCGLQVTAYAPEAGAHAESLGLFECLCHDT